MHLQSSTSKLPPCPSPASSIGRGARKLLGSSAWNSTACASIREVVRLPQNCKAARQPLRDSGQQAQRCHSSCPTTVTVHCHQNSPSPVGHWAPRSGAAASPSSWKRGLLHAGHMIKRWQSPGGDGQPPLEQGYLEKVVRTEVSHQVTTQAMASSFWRLFIV